MNITIILALSLTHAWQLLLTQRNDTGALSLVGGGYLEYMDFLILPCVGGTVAHLLFLILRGIGRDAWQFGGAAVLLLPAILALSLFHALNPLLMRRNVTGRKSSLEFLPLSLTNDACAS